MIQLVWHDAPVRRIGVVLLAPDFTRGFSSSISRLSRLVQAPFPSFCELHFGFTTRLHVAVTAPQRKMYTDDDDVSGILCAASIQPSQAEQKLQQM